MKRNHLSQLLLCLGLIMVLSSLMYSCGGENNNSSVSESTEATEEATESIAKEDTASPLEDEKTETQLNREMSMESETMYQPSDYNVEDFIGSYVGEFIAVDFKSDIEDLSPGTYMNKINISIDNINGENVIGHSVVAGNSRPFKGTLINPETLEFEVSEPGDDKYDGVFQFEIDPAGSTIWGKWFANDKNLKVPVRKFSLPKKVFSYNKNLELPESLSWKKLYDKTDWADMDGEFLSEDVLNFNPSNTELKASDIENMYKGDLEIMRNSIYARHGYSFKNRKIRYVFNYVDWYIPVSTDVRNELTPLEVKNIELIKRYEEHAEKYYDSYGR